MELKEKFQINELKIDTRLSRKYRYNSTIKYTNTVLSHYHLSNLHPALFFFIIQIK